jgi:cytochrome P450
VILLSGETHLRRRRLVSPPFHGDQLRAWNDVIADVADRELERVPRELPIAVRPTMQRITVEVICRVVFGVDDPAELEHLYKTIAQWSSPRFAMPLMFPRLRVDLGHRSPWGALLKARADMNALLDELIEAARQRSRPALALRHADHAPDAA